MTLIALTGYARSGKDTVGQILVRDHGYRRVAFGDILKAIAEDLNSPIRLAEENDSDPVETTHYFANIRDVLASYDGSWEQVKDSHPEARKYLVDLGNSLRRRIPGVEVDATFAVVLPGELVVNTNVYHAEEIDHIRARGGHVVRVRRPGFGPANADEARTGEHPVDAEIYNAGTIDDLTNQVAALARAVPGVSGEAS